MKSLRVGCFAVFLLILMFGSTERTIGQTNARSLAREDVPTRFDIPAQPLLRALDVYSAVTGLMVFYNSDLAEGRRSTAVSGVLMPDVAIRVLLEGTGLVVFNAGQAFAIEAESSDRQSDVPGAANAAELSYLAMIQHAIERGFCEAKETKPGEYRAALQFGIGSAGEILSAELLSSTGDQTRDRMIIDILSRLRIGRRPPPGMAQPVAMIISPRPPAQSGDCGFAENPSARRVKP